MIQKLLAQKHTLNTTVGGEGLGPLSTPGSGETSLRYITNIVSALIGFLTVAAGIWFIFQFLIGGYTWLSSMGDKHRLEEARNRIVNALIGLVIVVAAYGIVALVGTFFDWDILITDPQTIIDSIKLK